MPTSAPPQDIAERIRIDLGVYFAADAAMIVKTARGRPLRRQPAARICARRWSSAPMPGLVQERAEKLLKTRGGRSRRSLPCRRSRAKQRCCADPARLFDEAAAISMMGGRRVVRVRGAGNDLAELFEDLSGRPSRRCAGGGGSGRSRQESAACASCSRTPTRPPPSPAIPTPRAIWTMWCATRLRARRPFHRARRAGRCGVAAGLGPRRDAARAGKAGALCPWPEKQSASKMSAR